MSLATMVQMQDAAKFSLFHPDVLTQAFDIMYAHNTYTEDEMREALYKLSALVSSVAIAATANIFLTEDELESMHNELDELEGMGL